MIFAARRGHIGEMPHEEGHLLSFPASVFELVRFPARWSAAPDVFGTSKQNDEPLSDPALRNYSACHSRKFRCMVDLGEIRSLLRIERKSCENLCMDSQRIVTSNVALL